MTYLSNLTPGSIVAAGKAGALAISQNDLLITNGSQLFSANVSDYAAIGTLGAAIVPATSPTAYNFYTEQGFNGKEVWVNPVDASFIVAAPYLASGYGIELFKYNSAGTLVGSLVIDSTGSAPAIPQIVQLSNGNLAVVWTFAPGSAVLNFVVLDTNLSVVVAKTSISTSVNMAYFDTIALSGGGFAVSFSTSSGVSLAIYSNTGSVTYAAATITSGATTLLSSRMTQLSNGNIAVGVASGSQSAYGLGFAIRSSVGVSVVAYTVLYSSAITAETWLSIASVPGGYFCLAISVNSPAVTNAYVLNNAGTVQGSAYSGANGGLPLGLTTDGTNFYLAYVGSPTSNIVLLPTTGTNYVTSTFQPSGNYYGFSQMTSAAMLFDGRGNLLMQCGVYNYVFQFNAAGNALQQGPATQAFTGYVLGPATLKNVGDFAALIVMGQVGSTSAVTFAVQKYAGTSVVGVSYSTLAAGNANTVVQYASPQNGALITNAVAGTSGKPFGPGAFAGCSGAINSNSVVISAGAGARRNIN